MITAKFKKKEIINLLFSNYECESEYEIDNIEAVVTFILEKLQLQINSIEDKSLEKLRISLRTIRSKRNQKWNSVHRIRSKFETKYAYWLNSSFEIPDLVTNIEQSASSSEHKSNSRAGRPPPSFQDLSKRSKMREVAKISLQNKNDPLRLISACRYAAKKSKEKDFELILKEIEESVDRGSKIKEIT